MSFIKIFYRNFNFDFNPIEIDTKTSWDRVGPSSAQVGIDWIGPNLLGLTVLGKYVNIDTKHMKRLGYVGQTHTKMPN